MPIVVAVLGIIIVVLGAAFFLIPSPTSTPKEGGTSSIVEESNLTKEMQAEEEIVDTKLSPTPITSTGTTKEETAPPNILEVNTEIVKGDTFKPAPVEATAKTFTETGSYLTPARTEHKIAVTLTLLNGIVTEADVIYDGEKGFSNPSHERFDGAYAVEVIGKPLSDISLSRVGGASLTSTAFNEAVTKIAAKQS